MEKIPQTIRHWIKKKEYILINFKHNHLQEEYAKDIQHMIDMLKQMEKWHNELNHDDPDIEKIHHEMFSILN